MKLDVLFVAEDYRPGWLGYGGGCFCGVWTAMLSLKWLWGWLGWCGVLVWPLVWGLGFVVVALVVFGLGTLLGLLFGVGKRGERVATTVLMLLGLSWLAFGLLGGETLLERGLGWCWWGVLVLVLVAEFGVRWWRRGHKNPDLQQVDVGLEEV